jgi:hypothetical protein
MTSRLVTRFFPRVITQFPKINFLTTRRLISTNSSIEERLTIIEQKLKLTKSKSQMLECLIVCGFSVVTSILVIGWGVR